MSVWDWHISKAVSTLVAAVWVLALMGCASSGAHEKNTQTGNALRLAELSIFTSRGLILTPEFTTANRQKRIYYSKVISINAFDPSRDDQFMAIYREYAPDCMSGDEISCHEIRKYVEYNHFLQSLDIVSAGCAVFKRTNGAVYYFYPKPNTTMRSDYPEGYYNPFSKYKFSGTYFNPNSHADGRLHHFVNEKLFFETKKTRLTSTFYTSENAPISEAFEFECMKLDADIN